MNTFFILFLKSVYVKWWGEGEGERVMDVCMLKMTNQKCPLCTGLECVHVPAFNMSVAENAGTLYTLLAHIGTSWEVLLKVRCQTFCM